MHRCAVCVKQKGKVCMKERTIHTPVGRLVLSACGGMLCGVRLAVNVQESQLCADDPVLDAAQRQFDEYFAAKRQEFDLPLHMEGSGFDCAVWQQLQCIPFGEVKTYGQLAASLGKSKASRAVGGACSRNPLLIVVPCHRVIAGTGKLTGFTAGIKMKHALLEHEGWEICEDKVILKQSKRASD